MQNRKGFTLVELLAVIVILASLVTIAVPTTMSVSKKVKANLYCSKIDLIEDAAKLYGEDLKDSFTTNITIDGTNYAGKQVTVSELVQLNYLKKDQDTEPYITDPRDENSSDLYNMTIAVYVSGERIYVAFPSDVSEDCDKTAYTTDNSTYIDPDSIDDEVPSMTPPTAKELVYNGSSQELIFAGACTYGTLYYKIGADGKYSKSLPTATNPGEYTIYYKMIPSNVYKYSPVEDSIKVTIDKANGSATAPTAKSLKYTGSSQVLINAGSSTTGTIQYKLGSSGTYSASLPKATAVGTYTVYYKVVGNSYYKDVAEKSISVTIGKGDGVVTAPSAKSLTYTGSAQTLINAGSSTTGTIQYKLGSSGTYSTSLPSATNAGTYTVYYKVVGNSNYNDVAEKSITVTIAKKVGSVTAPTAKSLTYNGSAQTLINAGSSTTGTIQYKLGSSGTYSTSLPSATNAGSYTVYYKVVGSSNYNDVSEKSITVTIAKKAGSVTAPTAKSLTYNGSAQTLINAGSSSTGTIQYKLNSSGTYSTSLPSATNAGTYTVYYKVVGSSNYNDVAEKSITVTIAKKAGSVTAPTGYTLTYTGSSLQLTSAGSSTTGTIQYKLGANGSYSTSLPKATNAGTYTIYYKVSESTNYNAVSERSVTATINKAAAKYTPPTGRTISYTGSAQTLINAGSTTTGTMYYKLGSGSYSTSLPSAAAVGTYTIYYQAVGDANHNSSSVGSVSSTIKQTIVTLNECQISVMSAGNSDTTNARNSLSCTNGTTATIVTNYIACDSTLTTYSTVAVKFKLAVGTYNVYMGAFGEGTYFYINDTKYNKTGTSNSNDYLSTTITVTNASSFVTLMMQNPGGGYVRMNASISRVS